MEMINVTPEAVEAGVRLANQLEEQCANLDNAAKALRTSYQDNQGGLGRHADSISNLLDALSTRVSNNRKTKKLVGKLRLTSKIRDAHINGVFGVTEVAGGTEIGAVSGSGGDGYKGAIAQAQSQPTPGYRDLSEADHQALETATEDRSWRQSERADSIRNSGYATQMSFGKDKEGKVVVVPHGSRKSQRPDEIRMDANGRIDIREVKDYHNIHSLMNNMRKQAQDRHALFGEDIDLTFVIAANDFSVEDAMRLQDFVENTLHAHIDWITK